MTTLGTERYKGYEISVQTLRRPKEHPSDPADAPREYDCIVHIARSGAGVGAKTEMFGVPTTEPLDSPLVATRVALKYAQDIIDGKITGISVAGL